MNPKHQEKSPEKKSRHGAGINRDVSGQERAEEPLSNSDGKFHFLFKSIPQGVVHHDADGHVIDANPAAQKILGLTLDQLLGRSPFDPSWKSIHEDGSEFPGETHPAMLALQTGKSISNVVMGIYSLANGEQRWININAIPHFHPGEKTPYEAYAIFEDITERRQAEKQIIQTKRLYATLSHMNETIVRVKDRADLYRSICRVAVKFGEFSLAWIGLLDEASKQVISVAADGQDGEQWPFQTVEIEDGALKDELVATALRTSKVATSDDIRTDARMQSLRDQLSEHDFHSSAVIPFRLRGRTIGVVNLISREVGLFKTESESLLLEEMGGDISFALDTIENETEHKLAEQQLGKSEEHYRLISENAMDVIWVFNPITNKFTYVSPSVEKLRGYTPAEIMAQPISESLTPESLKMVGESLTKNLQAFMKKGSGSLSFVYEVDQLHRNGSIVNTEVTTTYLFNQHGLVEIVGVSRDVTQRKQTEKKLKESEHDLQNFIDNSPDTIYMLDLVNHSSRFLNRVEFLGYSKHELELENSIMSAIHPEDFAIVAEQWKEMTTTAENQLTTIQYRVKNKNGRLEWIQQRTTVLARAENGSPQKLLITLSIITERVLAEHERGILASLVESSPDFIGTAALDGQVLFVNKSGRALVGLQDTDVTQLKINEFTPPGSPFFDAALQSIKSSGQWQGEGNLVNFKTNEKVPVQVQVFVIPHPQTHQPMAMGTVMQNITERKQAEKQIQLQLQRMSALGEIDHAISSSLDIRLSLDILLNETLTQLGVDAASIMLLNPFNQTLEYVAGKGFRTLRIRQSISQLGEGLAGRVGLERKALHIPNLAEVGSQFHRRELLKEEEFIEYFGIPLIAKGTLKGVLEVFHRSPLNPNLEWKNYLETLGGQAAIAIDNVQLFEGMQQSNLELITAYDATIVGWSRALDLRDKETEGHSQRVTELTIQLAKKMGINQSDMVQIRRGALLHDIGKLGVPDNILLKPDKLSDMEWAIMRQHPVYAYKMLLPIAYLRPALDIPHCHHEKWDGSGYPRGLEGEQIPIAARIFAIVDVWDALRSDRPYRPGWSAEKTREYIISQSGIHFEPRMVESFLSVLDETPNPG